MQIKREKQTVHSRSLSVYNDKYSPSVKVRLSANNLQYRYRMPNCSLPHKLTHKDD